MGRIYLIVGGILAALLPWLSGGRDGLAMLISAFGLSIAVVLSLQVPGERKLASRPLAIALGVWVGWAVLSLIWSVNRYQTEWWIMVLLLMILAATATATLSRAGRNYLVNGYLVIASAVTVYGFYLYFTSEYERFTATFYWANPMAAYLIPAIVILGWRWATGKRWYDLLGVLLLASGFWLTNSRGATLVLASLLIVTIFFSQSVRKHWRAIVIVVLASFVIATGLAWAKTTYGPKQAIQPGSRFSEAAQAESTSFDDRINYLESAINIWWERPLIGSGAGTYATMHPQYQQRTISASSDAHNFYVQTLAEQGIIGFSLLAWVIAAILLGVINGIRKNPSSGIYAFGAATLLLHTGLDINARYPSLMILLAVLLALVYQPIIASKVDRASRMRLLLLVITTVVLVVANYQSAIAQRNGEIHNDNGDLQEAAKSFNRAHSGIVYDPDVWGAEAIDYYVLAASNENTDQNIALARDRANQAIKRDPQDAQHYFLLGRIERLDGNQDAAKRHFEQALKLDPYNHAEYYGDYVALQIEQGELQGAKNTLAIALNRYTDPVITNRHADRVMKPAVSALLVFQAQILLQEGDVNGARQSLERAKRLNPNNPQILQLESQLPQGAAA